MLDFPFGVLLPLLPGVGVLGSRLAARALDDRLQARILTPLASLAIGLLAIHVVSLVLASFHFGLLVATVGLGLGGYALAVLRWRQHREPAREGAHWPRGALLVAVASAAFVAPFVIAYSFHDELFFLGHFSMSSGIATGWYPPRHVTFPEFPLKYHYGFDLLVATVMSLFHLGVDLAVDLTSLVLFAYSGLLAWLVVGKLTGARAPPYAPALFLFAAGLPTLAPALFDICDGIEATCELLSLRSVGSMLVNPPFVSNFFQHPWSLGVPLGLGLWALYLDQQARPRVSAAWAALTAGLTALLSLSQVVLFVGLTGALAGGALVRAAVRRSPLDAFAAAALALGAASAPLLGGFFVPGQVATTDALVLAEGGIAGGLVPTVHWHLATLGLMLPLGVAGLAQIERGRLAMVFFLAGNLLVANVLRYRYSWDIVKFVTAASTAAALLSVPPVARLIDDAKPTRRTLGVACAFAMTCFGVGFQLPYLLGLEVPFARAPRGTGRFPGLSPDDAAALDWLRRNARNDELVFRRPDVGRLYALYGGIPQIWGIDVGAEGFGFDEARFERRRAFRRGLPGCRALARERVRWVVVEPGEPRPTVDRLRALSAAGLAHLAHEEGDLRVFRIEYEGCADTKP